MLTTPTRPEIGAVTVYQPSCTFMLSIAALSPRIAAFEVSDRGLGVVEVDHRRRRARDQIGVAGDVALGLFELRLVLGELRLRAGELRLGLPVVERDQDVARLDRGAVGDQHLFDRRVEMRAQRDGRDRLRRADFPDLPGHVLAHGGRDEHRDGRPRRRGGGALAAAGAPVSATGR